MAYGGARVNMNSIGALTSKLDIFYVYGFTAFLTLLVILHKLRLVVLPRPLILFSWYGVVGLAASWLAFHSLYFFSHHEGASRLVTYALIFSFIPVYICALVLLFIYPKKTTPP
ncbi:membrane hypothetical protein [Massilia sp. 9I]|nr:membrane hypothetical protein [Massilia sp. 9I]